MSKFADYVTSTAFHLSLSRPMIECLSQLDHYGESWANLATGTALENRGLVERASVPSDLPESVTSQFVRMVIRLTDAGRAVIPLLKLSGLYVQYPERSAGVDVSRFEVKLKPEFTK